MLGMRLLDKSPEIGARFGDELSVAPVGGEPVTLDVSAGADIAWSATAPRGAAYFETLRQILN
ncbi:hypothetical protein ACFE33_12520 [Falsihalocynthiibacter sp. SS001]|uniref:hypothetical protein n=1 Tax=Falsihalocynthiibacter sp. SS001 TaxID=3349698 RepID=UPI0036D2B282